MCVQRAGAQQPVALRRCAQARRVSGRRSGHATPKLARANPQTARRLAVGCRAGSYPLLEPWPRTSSYCSTRLAPRQRAAYKVTQAAIVVATGRGTFRLPCFRWRACTSRHAPGIAASAHVDRGFAVALILALFLVISAIFDAFAKKRPRSRIAHSKIERKTQRESLTLTSWQLQKAFVRSEDGRVPSPHRALEWENDARIRAPRLLYDQAPSSSETQR